MKGQANPQQLFLQASVHSSNQLHFINQKYVQFKQIYTHKKMLCSNVEKHGCFQQSGYAYHFKLCCHCFYIPKAVGDLVTLGLDRGFVQISDAKMAPIHSNGVAHLARTPKKFSSFRVYFWNMWPTEYVQWYFLAHGFYIMMTSQIFKLFFSSPGQFYKYETTMAQKFRIERFVIALVCSSRCPINSFKDVSFVMVVYGENSFWAAIPRVTTRETLLQG